MKTLQILKIILVYSCVLFLAGCHQQQRSATPLPKAALSLETLTATSEPTDLQTKQHMPSGRIIYLSDNALYIMNGDGKTENTKGEKIEGAGNIPYSLSLPRWSPNGTQLAVACRISSFPDKYVELNLCILNLSDVEWDLDMASKNPKIIEIDRGSYEDLDMYISGVGWSSDGSTIFVRSQLSENPFCFINTHTYEKDCYSPLNQFYGFSGFTDEDKDLQFGTLAWHPTDVNKIAFSVVSKRLYIADLIKNRVTVLAEVPYIGFMQQPVWSPDGKKIAFIYREHSKDDYNNFIAIANVDDSGFINLIDGDTFFNKVLKKMGFENDEDNYFQIFPESWSPDGRFLLITVFSNANFSGIFRYDLQTGEIKPLKFDFGDHTYYSPHWVQ